jgi:5'-nucleotidase
MTEWWKKHIGLLVKYKLSEKVIKNVINKHRIMKFRKGAKEFLEDMYNKKVPVIIISAGIGNFIKEFLIKNNCYYDNIYIASNFIKFENNVARGIEKNIVHTFNKNEVSLPKYMKEKIRNRKKVILFGDTVADVLMVPKNIDSIKIGFLDKDIRDNLLVYKESFDIVCTNNTSFKDIEKIIN